jgi:hypothetical protein
MTVFVSLPRPGSLSTCGYITYIQKLCNYILLMVLLSERGYYRCFIGNLGPGTPSKASIAK